MMETDTGLKEPSMDKQYSWKHLFMLGIISMTLSSFFPLSIFAPFPIALMIILHGRSKGILVGAVCLTIFMTFSLKYQVSPVLGVFFATAFIFALFISEIILRGINPIRGFIGSGFTLLLIVILLLAIMSITSGFSLMTQLEENIMHLIIEFKQNNPALLTTGGEEGRIFRDFVSDPRNIIQEMLRWGPITMFLTIFAGLWISMFTLLRNSKFWRKKHGYNFTLKDFVHFKMPEYLVWPLIGGLFLALAGEYILPGQTGTTIGIYILYGLGIFYFFHGFGIYMDFLTHIRIVGFIRTALVVITVLMAWRIVAVIGVFDMWVNFRKFLKRKDNTN